MSSTNDTIDFTHFDVREIPCREKHARIFQRWADLSVGAHFVLVNDHDPVPLYYQFAAQFPGAFNWEYLVAGPGEFQVKITRLAASPAGAAVIPPPRSCGHHAHHDGGPAPAHFQGELDVRGLEPPEPLMRILTAAGSLGRGTGLHARTDRKPVHLYAELDARHLRYASEEQPDGSWLTTISRE
jgi:uncharacterized protein (DUF2249 family)